MQLVFLKPRQHLTKLFWCEIKKKKKNASTPSPCRCKCTPNSNLITFLSAHRRLNINEERLIAAICRAHCSTRESAFSSASSSCPAKPSGNFTPGKISACEWHVNGCVLVPPGLRARIQLQSHQRYMTTREMDAINGRCVSAILIFHRVFWIQILSWHIKRNKLWVFIIPSVALPSPRVCIVLSKIRGGSGKYHISYLACCSIFYITSEMCLCREKLVYLEVENPCVSFGLFTTRGQCENKSDCFIRTGPLWWRPWDHVLLMPTVFAEIWN